MRKVPGLGLALALALALVACAGSVRAEGPVAPGFGGDVADDAKPPTPVRLTVDVSGPVRVVTNGKTLRCPGPCAVDVEPGSVEVSANNAKKDVWVDGPSRVTFRPGAPAVQTAGLALFLGGGAVVVAGIAVPILVCGQRLEVTPSGQTVNRNPCRDVSDAGKVEWIAGIGVGLTATLVGAFLFAGAGPSLRLTSDAKVSIAGPGARFELRF